MRSSAPSVSEINLRPTTFGSMTITPEPNSRTYQSWVVRRILRRPGTVDAAWAA
jgi:hypothetical protein